MFKHLFKVTLAAMIIASAFSAILMYAPLAKMSDIAAAAIEKLSSHISSSAENDDVVRIQSDGDDIVILSADNAELYRVHDALPTLPDSERSLIERGFYSPTRTIEKMLEAYTS